MKNFDWHTLVVLLLPRLTGCSGFCRKVISRYDSETVTHRLSRRGRSGDHTRLLQHEAIITTEKLARNVKTISTSSPPRPAGWGRL